MSNQTPPLKPKKLSMKDVKTPPITPRYGSSQWHQPYDYQFWEEDEEYLDLTEDQVCGFTPGDQ